MNQVYQDIEQHIRPLRRYAGALTHDPIAAEDLVQECMTRALAKSRQFQPNTNLRAWLFTILRNQHISNKRRETTKGITIDPDDVALALATRPDQETGLKIEEISRAFLSLPTQQRKLLEAIGLRNESYEDVAASSKLPVGTVKSRVARARQRLRQLLGRD